MITNLNYCLMVTGPAYGNQRSSSALQFAQTLIICKHRIRMVFFYQDGVYNANRFTSPTSNEVNLVQSWRRLSKQYHIPLHVCIAAALRRGIIDNEQAILLKFYSDNLQSNFKLSGLGVLSKEIFKCDRFIQF